jgi:hypothetical protein
MLDFQFEHFHTIEQLLDRGHLPVEQPRPRVVRELPQDLPRRSGDRRS